MHVRFSSILGMEVTEHGSEAHLGTVAGILLHPDTGKVEGFLVRGSGRGLFASSIDIVHIGTHMDVRREEVLGAIEDVVRLQPLLEDRRTIIGQPMRTESGQDLGRCRDVQFDTEALRLEWLFPKRFLRWGTAVPVSDVIEVQRDAIVVRDQMASFEEQAEQGVAVLDVLPEVSGPAA